MKLNDKQSTILRVMAQACRVDGELGTIPWYPRETAYLEDRQLLLSTSTAGPSILFLIRKGLATAYPKLGKYSCIITELGREIAEQEKGKPIAFISPFDQQEMKRRRLEKGEEEDL